MKRSTKRLLAVVTGLMLILPAWPGIRLAAAATADRNYDTLVAILQALGGTPPASTSADRNYEVLKAILAAIAGGSFGGGESLWSTNADTTISPKNGADVDIPGTLVVTNLELPFASAMLKMNATSNTVPAVAGVDYALPGTGSSTSTLYTNLTQTGGSNLVINFAGPATSLSVTGSVNVTGTTNASSTNLLTSKLILTNGTGAPVTVTLPAGWSVWSPATDSGWVKSGADSSLAGTATAKAFSITSTNIASDGSGNLVVDFLSGGLQTHTAAGTLNVLSSNIVSGQSVYLEISAGAADRTITFNIGTNWLCAKPTTISANHILGLSLFATGKTTNSLRPSAVQTYP